MKCAVFFGVVGGAALLAGAYPAGAATAPSLGTAQSFAVLGGTTVTNTNATTINGDLGVSPGSAITGTASITLTGSTHAGDAVALQAQNDVTSAYNALAGQGCTQSFTGTAVEVGSQTLTPGVYCYSSSAQLTGTLILNGNGVYIFKTVSTLTTAVGSSVSLIGGAQACNVFWQIGSSADLFTNTTFVGNILALTSITLQNGTSVAGRALARNGAVTMDHNNVSRSSCAAGATPGTTPSTTPTVSSSGATATAAAAGPNAPAGTPPSGAPGTPTSATPGTTGPPSIVTPGLPRLPNAGGGPPQGGRSDRLLVLVASLAGCLALGFIVRTHGRRPE